MVVRVFVAGKGEGRKDKVASILGGEREEKVHTEARV
jgi:hypothetical protein